MIAFHLPLREEPVQTLMSTARLPEGWCTVHPADRQLLESLLAGPIEYVDHPDLHEPTALAELKTRLGWPQGESPAEILSTIHPHDQRPLGSQEEVLLFKAYNLARLRFAELLAGAAGLPLSEERIAGLLGWGRVTLALRNRIAIANIGLVVSTARRMRCTVLDLQEAISAGHLALLRSIERFDCARGYKFSTYACQGIFQRILHAAEAVRNYNRRFVAEYEPSLDKADLQTQRHAEQLGDLAGALDLVWRGNKAKLSDLEREVLRCRFALGQQGNPMTLKAVGAVIGITKERVRQIQKRALAKLRSALERDFVAA